MALPIDYYNELLWLLASPLLEVKGHAAARLQSLTDSVEGLQLLGETAEFLFDSVSIHFGEPKEVSEPLLRLLVELSQDLEMSSKMVTSGLVRRAMDFLYKQEPPVTGLIVNLLVSLTHHPDGVASFFQTLGDEEVDEEEVDEEEFAAEEEVDEEEFAAEVVEEFAAEVVEEFDAEIAVEATVEVKKLWFFVLKLVNSFCIASEEASYGKKTDDSFENVGSLLVNLAKSVVGRKFFLDPTRGLLKQIVQQYDSQSSLMKLLVSEVGDFYVKYDLIPMGFPSRFFGADEAVDSIFGADFLWIALLLPLAGKKVHNELDNDISKMPIELLSTLMVERELVDSPKIRIAALEVFRLVASRDAGQRALMSVNASCVMEVGYQEEVHPKVIKAYERIGYDPLFEQLCSKLATVKCLESMGYYKIASCMALDSLCDIVSEIGNTERIIMHRLKSKWVINDALYLFNDLIESNQKAEVCGLAVAYLMEHWHGRLMRFVLSGPPGPATKVFLLLEKRYPQLMLYFQVRRCATRKSKILESIKQFGVTKGLFELYGIPHRIGSRR